MYTQSQHKHLILVKKLLLQAVVVVAAVVVTATDVVTAAVVVTATDVVTAAAVVPSSLVGSELPQPPMRNTTRIPRAIDGTPPSHRPLGLLDPARARRQHESVSAVIIRTSTSER